MEEFAISVNNETYSIIPLGEGTGVVFQIIAGDATERFIQKGDNGQWNEINQNTKLPLRDEFESDTNELGRQIESHYE